MTPPPKPLGTPAMDMLATPLAKSLAPGGPRGWAGAGAPLPLTE